MIEFPDDSVQGFFEHGEANGIYALAINPVNSDCVCSGGANDQAFLWNSNTGQTLSNLNPHKDSVVSVGFSFDGKYVASGGMDGRVKIFLVENGNQVCSLEGPDEVLFLLNSGNLDSLASKRLRSGCRLE